MVKDKMLVCFTVDKTALGTSQITDLTLNMSVIYEDGHRTERQATDPKILHFSSEESSSLSANSSSDSAIGNVNRPNHDQQNGPYEGDDEAARDSLSWLSQNSNRSHQRGYELQLIRRERVAANQESTDTEISIPETMGTQSRDSLLYNSREPVYFQPARTSTVAESSREPSDSEASTIPPMEWVRFAILGFIVLVLLQILTILSVFILKY